MENAFTVVVKSLTAKGEARNPLTPEDYKGVTDDGREAVFCGVCGEPKRVWREMSAVHLCGLVPTLCACGRKRRAAHQAENTEETRRTLRNKAGNLSPEHKFTDSEKSPEMDKCWRYTQKWDEMKVQNIGLLLWGSNGPGKSHAAHCIANALLERDPPVSVYVKTFAAILQGQFDKSEILDSVHKSSLVILEDLGAERGNDYAFETIFAIVDERYQSRKPTIVTTNLTWDEVQNPTDERGFPDRRRKRIYDRIVEMCVPIQFSGTSRRNAINAGKTAFVKNVLGL